MRRFGQHGDEIVVLGGGADEGGAADVDVFDAVLEGSAAGDGGFEGVEVDGDEVDGRDVVGGHLRLVFRQVAPAEDAAVDLGDEGFDAAVEDFGEAGVVGDLDDRDSGIAQGLGGTAGRQDEDAGGGEGLAEFDEAGFVGNGDQCAANGNNVGHRGCPRLEWARDRPRGLGAQTLRCWGRDAWDRGASKGFFFEKRSACCLSPRAR